MIAAWTSSVDADSGFLEEVITALSEFPDRNRDVSLVLDAMSIKKGIIWEPVTGKYVGFVDYGNANVAASTPTSLAQATEALYFYLVALNGSWKLPIGYFLINKIKAPIQGQLVNKALILTEEKGIRVRNITFDGAPTNLVTAKYLAGTPSSENEDAELDNCHNEFDEDDDQLGDTGERDESPAMEELKIVDQLPHYFPHQLTGKKIYIILDPSHMLKLVRNALGNLNVCMIAFRLFLVPCNMFALFVAAYKVFRSGDELIQWSFIVQLYNLQEELGLRFANKLRRTISTF